MGWEFRQGLEEIKFFVCLICDVNFSLLLMVLLSFDKAQFLSLRKLFYPPVVFLTD